MTIKKQQLLWSQEAGEKSQPLTITSWRTSVRLNATPVKVCAINQFIWACMTTWTTTGTPIIHIKLMSSHIDTSVQVLAHEHQQKWININTIQYELVTQTRASITNNKGTWAWVNVDVHISNTTKKSSIQTDDNGKQVHGHWATHKETRHMAMNIADTSVGINNTYGEALKGSRNRIQ